MEGGKEGERNEQTNERINEWREGGKKEEDLSNSSPLLFQKYFPLTSLK